MCILGGCDYLEHLPGIGLKTSSKLFEKLCLLKLVKWMIWMNEWHDYILISSSVVNSLCVCVCVCVYVLFCMCVCAFTKVMNKLITDSNRAPVPEGNEIHITAQYPTYYQYLLTLFL